MIKNQQVTFIGLNLPDPNYNQPLSFWFNDEVTKSTLMVTDCRDLFKALKESRENFATAH